MKNEDEIKYIKKTINEIDSGVKSFRITMFLNSLCVILSFIFMIGSLLISLNTEPLYYELFWSFCIFISFIAIYYKMIIKRLYKIKRLKNYKNFLINELQILLCERED